MSARCPPDSEKKLPKLREIQEKEEKTGKEENSERKAKNQKGRFPLSLLVEKAGYVTAALMLHTVMYDLSGIPVSV